MAPEARLSRAALLERLDRLAEGGCVMLDPAALFGGGLGLPAGAVVAAEPPGRLYHVEVWQDRSQGDLPETVSLGELRRLWESPTSATLDERFLPLDHPEGVMARFNRWFYGGLGARAFEEGGVPSLAANPHLTRAEAALLARLARRAAGGLRVLKLGAGSDVEQVRLLFEELQGIEPPLARHCQLTLSDMAASLMAEAEEKARRDPVLSPLLRAGQVRFRVLDARRPGLEGERFNLIQSSYLYDSLPQRELAWVRGRWYEFKARPQLAPWPGVEAFRQALLAGDLAALEDFPADLFGLLDWQAVLDPLCPDEVPHRRELEEVCAGLDELALPLGDALISGVEALLPHLASGGAVQTFDLAVPGLVGAAPAPALMFRGPDRIGGALFLGQNFPLARRLFAARGLAVSLLSPDRYLEEMLGEEAACLDQLWLALAPQSLEGLLGADFVARFRGCLEGEGEPIFREMVESEFIMRSEAEAVARRYEALGLDGRGFLAGLFERRERLRDEGAFEQLRIEVP